MASGRSLVKQWETKIPTNLLDLPYEIVAGTIENSTEAAIKFSVETLANLVSAVMNYYPYII